MGHSVITIPFFDPNIELDVHTATHGHHIGHTSIRHFADWVEAPITLQQRDDNGEYLVSCPSTGEFIEGQEI